jgi:hypothetical protein
MPSGGRPAEKASPKLPPGWCIDPMNGRYWCDKELNPGGMIPPGVDGVVDEGPPPGSCRLAEEDGFEEEDAPPAAVEDLEERLLRR